MKKISLRTLMFIQALVAFCIPLYYHLMVVYHLNSNIPLFIAIIIIIAVGRLKKNAEVMDEYAKKTLQIADSICFKASLVVMGIIILPFLFFDEQATFIGYLITLGIFVLILVRACIFCWIDKKGMK